MKDGKAKMSKKKILFISISVVLIFETLVFVLLPIKGYIPILMYHYVVPREEIGTSSLSVSIDDFQKQMWFLKTFGFKTISLDEFYAIKTGKEKPRGREVLITFDDGHSSYVKYALPIMERYQIKSANFLIWDHLTKAEVWSHDIHLEEAKHLVNHPLVTWGSHTLTHPVLREVSLEQATTEIFLSKERLEEAFKKRIDYFCYPGGSFTPGIAEIVEKAGYRLAFRTSFKYYKAYPETLYSLSRIKVSPRQSLFVFWLNISGIVTYAKEIDAFFHQLTGHKPNDKLTLYEPAYKSM